MPARLFYLNNYFGHSSNVLLLSNYFLFCHKLEIRLAPSPPSRKGEVRETSSHSIQCAWSHIVCGGGRLNHHGLGGAHKILQMMRGITHLEDCAVFYYLAKVLVVGHYARRKIEPRPLAAITLNDGAAGCGDPSTKSFIGSVHVARARSLAVTVGSLSGTTIARAGSTWSMRPRLCPRLARSQLPRYLRSREEAPLHLPRSAGCDPCRV